MNRVIALSMLSLALVIPIEAVYGASDSQSVSPSASQSSAKESGIHTGESEINASKKAQNQQDRKLNPKEARPRIQKRPEPPEPTNPTPISPKPPKKDTTPSISLDKTGNAHPQR